MTENTSRESSPDIFFDADDNQNNCVTELTNSFVGAHVTIDDNETDISSSLPSNSQASSFKESDYESFTCRRVPSSVIKSRCNKISGMKSSGPGRPSSSRVADGVNCNCDRDDNESIPSSFPFDSQSSSSLCDSQSSSLKESDYELQSAKDGTNKKAYRKKRDAPYRSRYTHLSNGTSFVVTENSIHEDGFEEFRNGNESDRASSYPSDSQSSFFPSQSSSVKDSDVEMYSQESIGASSSSYMADISNSNTDSTESFKSNGVSGLHISKRNYRHRLPRDDSVTRQSHDELSRTTTDSDIFSLTSIPETNSELSSVSGESATRNSAFQIGQNLAVSDASENVCNNLPQAEVSDSNPSTSAEHPDNLGTRVCIPNSAVKYRSNGIIKVSSLPGVVRNNDEVRRHGLVDSTENVQISVSYETTERELTRSEYSVCSGTNDILCHESAHTEDNLSDKENEFLSDASRKRKYSDGSDASRKIGDFCKKHSFESDD